MEYRRTISGFTWSLLLGPGYYQVFSANRRSLKAFEMKKRLAGKSLNWKSGPI